MIKTPKQITLPDNRSEGFYRFLAFIFTGFQCTLYALTICLLMVGIYFLVFLLVPVDTTLYSSDAGTTAFGFLFSSLLYIYILIPVPLAWFLTYPLPLKKKHQTWGMKLMGLKIYHSDQNPIKWSSIMIREVPKFIGLLLIVGISGFIWMIFDQKGRTLYDTFSGIIVIKEEPKLKIAKEFRDYRNTLRITD